MVKIIGIEGIDGSGKSLQCELLMDRLQSRGHSCMALSFPVYTSFFGREIGAMLAGSQPVRADLVDAKSMALWYGLDRMMQMKEFDRNAYDFLVLNRYTLANAVYQGVRYNGDREGFGKWVYEMEHEVLGLPVPDIYFVLDVDETISRENNLKKSERAYIDKPLDVYEESTEILQNARSLYREIGGLYKNIRLVRCMENGVQKTPEAIHTLLMKEIDDILY